MLEKITQILKLCLLTGATFCLVSAGVLFIHIKQDADATAAATQASLVHIVKDVDNVQVMASATLYQVGDTAHELSDMARVEKAAQTQQLEEINKVFDQLNATIQNVDANQAAITANINASLVPIRPAIEQSQATLAEMQEAIKNLNTVIQDPAIPSTLAHVNSTMVNVQNTSAEFDAYVKRVTTPRGFVSTLWHGLLSLATPLTNVLK